MKEPKEVLKESLNERVASNPGYSLRAFARDLEVSPQQLSNIINGRKGMSERSAEKMALHLGLSTHQKNLFCTAASAKFSRNRSQRTIAKTKLAHLGEQKEVLHLELDLFKIISNWYHLALIELIKIEKLKSKDFARIAKRLGIPEIEAKLALARLMRLNLISKPGLHYVVNQSVVVADLGIPHEAVKNFHRQVLARATDALAKQTEQDRYGSSSVLPMRVKDVKKVKGLIQEFREKISDELVDSESGEEIFGLSIQFFKLTE